MKIRIHVNKNEIRKGPRGFPWTIHTSRGCTKAKYVRIMVPSSTEFCPTKKSNPKCFILVEDGQVVYMGDGFYLVKAREK